MFLIHLQVRKQFVLLFILLILFISGFTKHEPSDPASSNVDLQQLYQASIEDATTADSSEVCDSLWAINSSNTKLVWSTINNEQYVLVGNLENYPDYYSNTSSFNSLSVIWVFLPQQMKSRIFSLPIQNNDTLLRISQLLGLPPYNTYGNIIELWVRPTDLFRPAGDNEIDDNTASAYLPANADSNYVIWYNQNIYDSYFANWTHYPWTRLGYTYDWGNHAPEVGLSEFCIKKNSLVYIKKLYRATEYLRN